MGDRASGGAGEVAAKEDEEALSIFQSLLFEEEDKSASEMAVPGAEKSGGGGGEGDESPSRVFTMRFRRGSQAVPAAAALTTL